MIQAYDVFMSMRTYKETLPKLRDELKALEEAEDTAWRHCEDESPFMEEYEALAIAATKKCEDMAEKIGCIENIVRLMRELNTELEFLEGSN